MERRRGFKLGHRLVKVFKWIIRPRRIKPDPTRNYNNPKPRTLSFARCIRCVANRLRNKPCPVHIRLGQKVEEPVVVPKGHLVVYVGELGCDTRRMVLPVVYINHPLFGELLKESERVFGFDQPGRITIPCRVSDFEKVQMRIAAWGSHCRKRIHRRS